MHAKLQRQTIALPSLLQLIKSSYRFFEARIYTEGNHTSKDIRYMEERQLILKDFSWVTCGLYRLFRSRKVLSYSYVFEYYIFKDDLF